MTLLLALDTSTRTASVALYSGQTVLSETTWLAGREHSTRVLLEASAALERIGLTATDLTGLVVARGPGSFTGVRVALSVAKGMAAALGIPAYGVSTLDALAHAARDVRLPVRAIVEAGRGRYATALYRDSRCIEPPRLATTDQLLELTREPILFIGELSTDARQRLEAIEAVKLASPALSLRRAGLLAELGWQQAQGAAAEAGDARLLDALYVS